MRLYFTLIIGVFAFCLTFGQNKEYKIGLLLDKSTSETDSLLTDLEKEIKAVVGEDANLYFPDNYRLNNNFNATLAFTNYQNLIESDVDIIIAFGLVNNLVISKLGKHDKPTIIFGNSNLELSLDENAEQNSANLFTITFPLSYEEDLVTLKDLANPKKVGVLIETALLENFQIPELFENLGDRLGFETEVIPFENLSDIPSKLETIDAVYLAGGFYLNQEEVKQLAEILINQKIPSITANTIANVENGILASNHDQSEIYQSFRKIALTVEAIVNGEAEISQVTKIEAKSRLSINYNTARKIGLPLKYSLIATTSFIGKPEEIESENTYSLLDILKQVIDENLILKTIEKDVELAEKDFKIAQSDYLPNVLANAGATYVDPQLAKVSNGQNPEVSGTGNISLDQNIFSEAINANISIQRSLQSAQKENFNAETLNTVFDAATAYFTALILKTNLSIQNQNLELTKSNLRIAEENYQAGQAGKSDVLRFRSEMAQNTQQVVEAINQLEQSFFTLNQLLNNPINLKIDVQEAELKQGVFENYNYDQLGQFLDNPTLKNSFVKFLISEAKANAPELKSIAYNLEVAERSKRLFGAGRFLPNIGLRGQYSQEFFRSGEGTQFPPTLAFPDNFYTVGLNISIPIFNQNKQNLNQQIAIVQTEQLEFSRENIELLLEKNINDAVLELINQISNIKISKVFEETAREALDLTQTSYANGAVNIVQLLDAQNNFLIAQQASANATYNYLQRAIQLERALGVFFLLQNETEREAFVERFLEFTKDNQD
ncbi:MAG: TolC family protein [Bacteroidota bacterium]